MTKKDKAEIALTKRMIIVLKRGYGKPCKTKDWEDFPELRLRTVTKGRCGACVAWETIQWLEEHIKLIKL